MANSGSFRSVLSLLVVLLGYGFGLNFLLCAILKPFLRDRIGLWIDLPSFWLGYFGSNGRATIGIGMGNPTTSELLGWWMVPIGLIVGSLLIFFTTRFWLSTK